ACLVLRTMWRWPPRAISLGAFSGATTCRSASGPSTFTVVVAVAGLNSPEFFGRKLAVTSCSPVMGNVSSAVATPSTTGALVFREPEELHGSFGRGLEASAQGCGLAGDWSARRLEVQGNLGSIFNGDTRQLGGPGV